MQKNGKCRQNKHANNRKNMVKTARNLWKTAQKPCTFDYL